MHIISLGMKYKRMVSWLAEQLFSCQSDCSDMKRFVRRLNVDSEYLDDKVMTVTINVRLKRSCISYMQEGC